MLWPISSHPECMAPQPKYYGRYFKRYGPNPNVMAHILNMLAHLLNSMAYILNVMAHILNVMAHILNVIALYRIYAQIWTNTYIVWESVHTW